MKSTLFIVAVLLLPCLAAAQQDPCQESANPFLEEVKMAVQNGDSAKGKEAGRRYGETVAKCEAAIIEAARRAADIEAATQFARQTDGQTK